MHVGQRKRFTHVIMAQRTELVFAVVIGAHGFVPQADVLRLGREYRQQIAARTAAETVQ